MAGARAAEGGVGVSDLKQAAFLWERRESRTTDQALHTPRKPALAKKFALAPGLPAGRLCHLTA
jgi:hypothetical protein